MLLGPLEARHRHSRASLVLRHAGDGRSQPDLDARHRGESPQGDLAELVLLGLHHVGIRRLVAQRLVIELRDESPRRSVPELKMPRDQANRLKLLEQAEAGEQFERRGVGRGRPGAMVDFAFGLEDHDAHAAPRARERRNHPDRSRADDADPRLHGGRAD